MADDINLPNLISHLQVNLANTSGLVSDATRQGSSVGSAIGTSMQRTLRAAVDDIPDIEIDGDSTELDRDLVRVRRQLQQLSEKRIGVDISVEDALREMARLEPHLERLRHSHPSVNVTAAVGGAWADLGSILDAARQVDETDVDIDVDVDVDDADRDLTRVHKSLGRVVSMISGLGGLALPFVKAGAAIGTVVPLVAGLATTLAQIAPAAAVGVSALLALKLATGTLKIAMTGVGDAVTAALDPAKADKYAEALKKLSPNARSFVEEIHKAAPALDKIRKTVQDKVFAGLDKQLKSTAKAALPDLRKALDSTSTTLNKMAKGVFAAARGLAKDGTLGKALDGATQGLAEFSKAPGQVVTALGQIGAAAAPAFKRLSKAGADALDRLSDKLTKAFESGAMEKAIDTAIDLLAQLGRVAGNIGKIISNIFGGLTSSGGSLFDTLEKITGALKEATATPGFQRAMAALSDTMSVVASTVAPLLVKALAILGPVIEKLAPPAQDLVKVLGEGLSKILDALGPVLVEAAGATGQLVEALLPFVDLAADLIAELLPSLTPLFSALGDTFEAAAPFVSALANNIGVQLKPLLEALPGILEQLLPAFVELAQEIFPQLTDILIEMAPDLLECSEALVRLLVDVTPLVVKMIEFAVALTANVLPAVGPVLVGTIRILAAMLSALADLVERYVLPAIKGVAAFLQGDFSGATKHAGTMVANFKDDALRALGGMVAQAGPLLVRFANAIGQHAREAGTLLKQGVLNSIRVTLGYFQDLPGSIRSALGGLNDLLYQAGKSVIAGFIRGVRSQISELVSTLSGITNMIPDWKGPAERDATLLTSAGASIMQGLQRGIAGQIPALRAQLAGITTTIPSMVIDAPAPRQIAATYAGRGDGGNTTINLYGSDATPGGVLDALSWHGLIGRRA